jgi:hypothetical protein
MASATKMSYTGFAIDWGDVANGGNAVGPYHIGDGTSATNLVLQPTSPAQGPSGSWGSITHTYAQAGAYKVCAILYDLGQVTPFKSTGYHSLRAAGADRNIDNSVDQGNATPATCTTVEVAAPAVTPPVATPPVATPFESFQGETATPLSTATPFETLLGETVQPQATATPPVTSTGGGASTPDQGEPLLALALALGGILGSVMVSRTAKARR